MTKQHDSAQDTSRQPAETQPIAAQEPCCPPAEVAADSCCADSQTVGTSAPPAQHAFQQFMSAAFSPGALDAVQKELTTIALSVAVQCEPCLRIHLDKALSMGITPEEIQEAAWMGVAFGGCKAMMFWGEHAKSLGTKGSPRASK